MTTGPIAVQQLPRGHDEPRFAVWVFNVQMMIERGPDGGEDHKGYTESQLREVLAERHVAQDDVDALIANAKANARWHEISPTQ